MATGGFMLFSFAMSKNVCAFERISQDVDLAVEPVAFCADFDDIHPRFTEQKVEEALAFEDGDTHPARLAGKAGGLGSCRRDHVRSHVHPDHVAFRPNLTPPSLLMSSAVQCFFFLRDSLD